MTTDASQHSVAAVLTQGGHPVLYVSRKLSPAEARWSNIEREAFAIVWAIDRLKPFLLGRRFKLNTDHKPLIFLFDPNKRIPSNASARIGRWAVALMAYDFDIAAQCR